MSDPIGNGIILLAAVAVAAGIAIALRFVPPLGSEVLIRLRRGKVVVRRGHLRTPLKDDAEEVLAGAGVKSGFIAIMPDKRVRFSRTIPTELHQRLRNVLLN